MPAALFCGSIGVAARPATIKTAPGPLLLGDKPDEGQKEMKFFTPQLLEEFRSSDEEIADAGLNKWEKQGKLYLDQLRAIHSQLPRQMTSMLDHYVLHDAKVSLARMHKRADWLGVLLQLDAR